MMIKIGQEIYVTSGKHKGKTGKVLSMVKDKQKAVIENVNVRKKHIKIENEGAIIDKAMPIHISNLKPLDKSR